MRRRPCEARIFFSFTDTENAVLPIHRSMWSLFHTSAVCGNDHGGTASRAEAKTVDAVGTGSSRAAAGRRQRLPSAGGARAAVEMKLNEGGSSAEWAAAAAAATTTAVAAVVPEVAVAEQRRYLAVLATAEDPAHKTA